MPLPAFVEILSSPDTFSRRVLSEPVALRGPTAIFLGFVVMRTAAAYLVFSTMIGKLPENLSAGIDWMTFGFGFTLFVSFVADVVFWYLGTGVLACLDILLDGDGEYRRLLSLTGYAHLPLLLFSLAALGFGLFYRADVAVGPKLDFSSLTTEDLADLQERDREEYKATVEGIGELLGKELGSAKFLVFASAKHCAVLWLVILVTVANARAYRMPVKKSALAVLGVVVLYVVLAYVRALFFPGGF
ncbi:MAG: YIP1 family protein [Planctomycetes bacterium]|nr:YIP1 family protein [Planctomycetota bacterium]